MLLSVVAMITPLALPLPAEWGGDDSDDNRDCVPKEYTIVQRVGDRDKVAYSFKPYAFTIPSNPMSDRMQMVIELCYEDRESAQRTD